MRPATPASLVKRSLSAHAAIGLLASALLYLVCLTGTVLVFYEQWQTLEQRSPPQLDHIRPEAVQRGMVQVLEREAGKPATTHLYIHLPADDLPYATVTTDRQSVHLNADGNIVAKEEDAWSEFLFNLHYTLQLPGLIGGVLVGVLGVAMLALSLSGVLAHPRIFRDAFRLRARDTGGLALADWHNRLGVWTLPFTLAIALTGAIIGLASLTAQGIAWRYYGGDIEKTYSPIFGDEEHAEKSPAPVPDVAAALRYMTANFPNVTISYAIIHDPLTRGQEIQLIGKHPYRLIFGEYYAFDSAGRFVHTVGLADGDAGQQAAASIYNLHFGNYGGLPVKIAYLIFGIATTAICATGTYIWLRKRRRRGHYEPRLTAAWDGVIWSAPLALTLSFVVRFAVGNNTAFGWIFWGTSCAGIAISVGFGERFPIRKLLQILTVASLICGTAIVCFS